MYMYWSLYVLTCKCLCDVSPLVVHGIHVHAQVHVYMSAFRSVHFIRGSIGYRVFGLSSDFKEGIVFSTYATLVSSVQRGEDQKGRGGGGVSRGTFDGGGLYEGIIFLWWLYSVIVVMLEIAKLHDIYFNEQPVLQYALYVQPSDVPSDIHHVV